MNHEYEQNRATARTAATSHNDTIEPGQSSRSALLRKPAHAIASGLIQRKATGPAPGHGASSVHQIADSGMSGIAGALPHLETIERSFGSHDVRGIRAFVGGAATAASRELGARAYATGDATVFAAPPDLHTAAHEAAHVIQQRGGVQLKGDMGEVGDRYEQHADAVADLVVQGRSAEALLGQYAGGGGGGTRGLQLLSDEDEEQLATYIDDKIEAADLTVQPNVRAAKCAEISKKYAPTDKKGLAKAKAEVVAWVVELKRAQAERSAQLLAAQAEKNQKAEKAEHKSKEPIDAEAEHEAPPSSSVASSAPTVTKKKRGVPLDLSKVAMPSPTPLTGFSAVVKASASLPDPIATPVKPVSKGPAMIANVQSWTPSSGHDGCNGSALSTAELQEVVNWAEGQPTRYFVKKGTGTGSYSTKNQLKIIHKVVKDGGKQATYHITAKQDALDALSVGDEDF